MPENDKMICPDCGAEMNHHADKLVYEDPTNPQRFHVVYTTEDERFAIL